MDDMNYMEQLDGNAIANAMDLDNLGMVAPHKMKYYNRYDMERLIFDVESGKKVKVVTFWQADKGCENRMLSQWFCDKPFQVNGRTYYTAEQYMMSETALMFQDYDIYDKIMKEKDPEKCKRLGKKVKNYDSAKWKASVREILFHGNLSKLQSDIRIVDALLETGDAVLVEASPYDDIYGAGLDKASLLNKDGTLKVMPQDWHKPGETTQAQNLLGFVLMGIRDLFKDLLPRGRDIPRIDYAMLLDEIDGCETKRDLQRIMRDYGFVTSTKPTDTPNENDLYFQFADKSRILFQKTQLRLYTSPEFAKEWFSEDLDRFTPCNDGSYRTVYAVFEKTPEELEKLLTVFGYFDENCTF